MKIYQFEIDTDFVPINIFDIRELGFIIYPSKIRESSIALNQNKNLLGVIFLAENIDFLNTSVNTITIKLIRFFNLIFIDHRAIEWLKLNTHLKKISENDFQEIEDLDTFIGNRIESDIKSLTGIYQVDLNNFSYPFSYIPFKIHFKKMITQYFKLDEKSPLKNKIDFFGLQSSLKLVVGSFYDNDNLEKSLQFMLLEHIINESITETEVQRDCEICKKQIPAKKGIKRKIREFFDNFKIIVLSKENKEILSKSLINMGAIRHSFFHAGSHYNIKEYYDQIELKKGETYTFQQEVDDKNPRSFAPLIFRALIQMILFDQLEKHE
jgi:hypothetical protein